MSIKSEKAKAYIMDRATDVDLDPETGWTEKMIERKHALAALKIGIADAEQKCRERAVRAFCGSCTFVNGEECSQMQGCECDFLEIFLKHYDNQ